MSMQWLGYKIETSVGVFRGIVRRFSSRPCFGLVIFAARAPRRIDLARQTGAGNEDTKPCQGMVAVAAGDAVEARRLSRKPRRC